MAEASADSLELKKIYDLIEPHLRPGTKMYKLWCDLLKRGGKRVTKVTVKAAIKRGILGLDKNHGATVNDIDEWWELPKQVQKEIDFLLMKWQCWDSFSGKITPGQREAIIRYGLIDDCFDEEGKLNLVQLSDVFCRRQYFPEHYDGTGRLDKSVLQQVQSLRKALRDTNEDVTLGQILAGWAKSSIERYFCDEDEHVPQELNDDDKFAERLRRDCWGEIKKMHDELRPQGRRFTEKERRSLHDAITHRFEPSYFIDLDYMDLSPPPLSEIRKTRKICLGQLGYITKAVIRTFGVESLKPDRSKTTGPDGPMHFLFPWDMRLRDLHLPVVGQWYWKPGTSERIARDYYDETSGFQEHWEDESTEEKRSDRWKQPKSKGTKHRFVERCKQVPFSRQRYEELHAALIKWRPKCEKPLGKIESFVDQILRPSLSRSDEQLLILLDNSFFPDETTPSIPAPFFLVMCLDQNYPDIREYLHEEIECALQALESTTGEFLQSVVHDLKIRISRNLLFATVFYDHILNGQESRENVRRMFLSDLDLHLERHDTKAGKQHRRGQPSDLPLNTIVVCIIDDIFEGETNKVLPFACPGYSRTTNEVRSTGEPLRTPYNVTNGLIHAYTGIEVNSSKIYRRYKDRPEDLLISQL